MAKRLRKKDHNRIDAPVLRVQVRMVNGVIGPGKIDLLEHVDREGGISAAARCMGMSFRRAWHLIQSMESAIGQAVVETEVGGTGGGGARLTEFGSELVKRYRKTMTAIDAKGLPFLEWLDSGRAAKPKCR